jgi:O-antigen biosynthesis protein
MYWRQEVTSMPEATAPQPRDPRVSTVVVLYNSSDYIEACLDSVAASAHPTQVVMVDNASTDGSAAVARKAAEGRGMNCLISVLQKNSGFARANDLGFRLATGDVILLLNPDTELYEDTIDALLRSFEDPSVGIAGCKVLYPDRKTLQHAGGWVRDNGLTMHYGVGEEDTGAWDTLADVPYVTGAALAVRRDVFERAGMLDAGFYPAYFEELDLCLHVRRLGYRVVYVPEARVVHHESVTTGKFTARYYYLYHKNRVRFLIKNFSWRFLLDRSLPMERRWLPMISMEEQGRPLKMAYLANALALPRTMLARWLTELRLKGPRIEDTSPEL